MSESLVESVKQSLFSDKPLDADPDVSGQIEQMKSKVSNKIDSLDGYSEHEWHRTGGATQSTPTF